MLGRIHIPRHVLRRDLLRHPRHADRRMHPQPPRIGLADLHRPCWSAGLTSRAGLPPSADGAGAAMTRATSRASMPSTRCPCRWVRSWLSWSASGVSGPPPDPRSMISRTRWPVSFSASTAPGTPRTSADDCPVPVRPASSSTASCPVIAACSTSSIVTDPASAASCTGLRKAFLITAANCLACSADRFISAAVSWTASAAAFRSARSWSLPSTSAVSFLRPASASSPTSQAPRSSATNTTLAVSGQRAPFRYSPGHRSWPHLDPIVLWPRSSPLTYPRWRRKNYQR